ncbi:uncharacterized protein KIAA1958-like [Argopecten irradians]|uniref:uncharacterized protein KIAA1958-like n=1 Tax=Argopecten irradians TaxID=31199 RepID=UPI003715E28B
MADTAHHRPNGSGTKRRFSEEDSVQFVQDHVSKKTKDVTRYAVSILREFCYERGLQETFELLSESDLCTLLKDFFTNVRNKKGELYSKSSICAIRQGIRRYLQEPPHNKTFDIINDPVFKGANQVFISMLKMTRAEGKGTVTHKKAIPAGDLQKLYSHPRAFNTDVPKGLLNKITFEIIFFFCRRGRENIRELKPSDFQVKTDDNEQRYICKTTSEKTKNHTGVTDELEGTGARMYETKNAACPVLSFEKYLSKRNPKCDALLQYPRNQYCDADQVWYENRPLGKNAIGEFMSNLSKE